MEELVELAKSKLNITWNDPGTNARLEAIVSEALPAVRNMAGISDAEFDFVQASMERNLLMNFIAYEWNHKAELFRDAYKEDIQACRQKHALEDAENAGE